MEVFCGHNIFCPPHIPLPHHSSVLRHFCRNASHHSPHPIAAVQSNRNDDFRAILQRFRGVSLPALSRGQSDFFLAGRRHRKVQGELAGRKVDCAVARDKDGRGAEKVAASLEGQRIFSGLRK